MNKKILKTVILLLIIVGIIFAGNAVVYKNKSKNVAKSEEYLNASEEYSDYVFKCSLSIYSYNQWVELYNMNLEHAQILRQVGADATDSYKGMQEANREMAKYESEINMYKARMDELMEVIQPVLDMENLYRKSGMICSITAGSFLSIAVIILFIGKYMASRRTKKQDNMEIVETKELDEDGFVEQVEIIKE